MRFVAHKDLLGYYQVYKARLEKALPSQQKELLEPKVLLQGKGMGFYRISQQTALDILCLNVYGDVFKKNDQGNHPVTSLGGLHFKTNVGITPLDPGMEAAMYAFQMLLVNQDITPTCLLTLKNVQIYKPTPDTPFNAEFAQALGPQQRSVFFERHPEFLQYLSKIPTEHIVQASRTVKGMGLYKFLEEVKEKTRSLDEIDEQSFSAQVLTSFLSNPFDAHGDNFMVVFNGPTGKGQIVGIDNDMALADPIIWYYSPRFEESSHFVEARNILYCFTPLMNKLIHPIIRDRVLRLNADLWGLRWLQTLNQNNVQYEALLKDKDREGIELPVHLRSGKGLKVIHELKRMQAYLRDYPDLTHNRLFYLLQPLVHNYYGTLLRHFVDPLEAYIRVHRGKDEDNTFLPLERILPLRSRLEDGRVIFKALREEKITKSDLHEKTQLPLQAMQELVHQLDLTSYSYEEQGHLLAAVPEEALSNPHPSWKDPHLIDLLIAGKLPPKALKTLGRLGFDLKARFQEDRSLIHEAIFQGRQDEDQAIALILELVGQGLSLDILDARARTPLDIVMEENLKRLFIFLVDKGALKVNWRTALVFYKGLNPSLSLDKTVIQAFKSLEARNQMISWRRALDVLLPPAGKASQEDREKGDNQAQEVLTPTMGKRILQPHLFQQLFDQKGNIKKVNRYGRRAVGKIAQDGYELYFKQYPEFPGTEQGVSDLMHKLINGGAPYSELMRIGNVPYLVSQGIIGLTLQDVLKDHPEWLKQLDPKSTSEMIVMAMLINPEDGKPDNYMVKPLGTDCYQLVAIDNDHAFGTTVAKEQGRAAVQVKCILYCLDQMTAPVHPCIWEIFQSLNAPQILMNWLRELSSLNKCYGDVFNVPEMKALMNNKDQESFIGVAFTNPMLRRLYEKMVRLQIILKEHQQAQQQDPGSILTHLTLLKKMEPVLGNRYERGFELYKIEGLVFERFMAVDGEAYLAGKKKVPQKGEMLTTSTNFKAFLTSLNIPLKEDILDIIQQGRHIGPDMALLEVAEIIKNANRTLIGITPEAFKDLTNKERNRFLKHLNFKTMAIPQQRAWLEVLVAQEDHRSLILKGCEALTDDYFIPQPLEVKKLQSQTKPAQKGLFRRKPKRKEGVPIQPVQEMLSTPSLEIGNLKKLDLSGCEGITDRLVPQLAKRALGLEFLTLDELPKLVKLQGEGEQLMCFPALQWLDISSCVNLVTLHLEAPVLRFLNANRLVRLSSFRLATPFLKELDVRGMKLLTDEVLDHHIQGWSQLKVLKLEGCDQVHEQEVRQACPSYPISLLKGGSEKIKADIVSVLKGTITSLDLCDECIRDAGAKAFGKALTHNTTLTSLDLGGNQIGAAGAEALGKALTHNTTLTLLVLGGPLFTFGNADFNNDVGDMGAQAFGKALTHNTALTSLKLVNNRIKAAGAEALGVALTHNTTLTSLDLDGNQIGAAGAEALGVALTHNTTLTSLGLWGNQIGAAGAEALGVALIHNTTLTSLALGSNQIGAAGAEAFGKVLTHNTTLTELNLNSNQIGDVGAEVLGKALTHNTTLTTLNLGGNQIEDVGAEALRKAVAHNITLTSLVLWANQFGTAGAEAEKLIDQILERNKQNRPAQTTSSSQAVKEPSFHQEPSVYQVLFKGKALKLQDVSLAPDEGFETLTGIDATTGLERLVHQSVEIYPLLASTLQNSFESRRLPPALLKDSYDLFQQWRQSRKILDDLIRPLRQDLTSLKTSKEIKAFIETKPESFKDQTEALEKLQIHLKAYEDIERQISLYCSQKTVLAAFLPYYLKQKDWLIPEKGSLGLLEAIAQLMKVGICIWKGQEPVLVHSFGPQHAKKITHLLQKREEPFKLLLPVHEDQQDAEDVIYPESVMQEEKEKGKEKEKEKGEQTERQNFLQDDLPPLEGDSAFFHKGGGLFRLPVESDVIRVGLSVDGEKASGLTFIKMLERFEEATKKKIFQLFDTIGGTSAGGLLSLGCVVTSDMASPLWGLKKLKKLFQEAQNDFSSPSPKHKGFLGKRLYKGEEAQQSVANPLEDLLAPYFKSYCLSDALIPVYIPATHLPNHKPYTFESVEAQGNQYVDYLMKDVAQVTLSTQSSNVSFTNILGDKVHTFMNGEEWIQNSTRLIYDRIVELYRPSPSQVMMVSVSSKSGTDKGSVGDALSEGVHLEMKRLLQEGKTYWHFQPEDEQSVGRMGGQIDELARKLAENADSKHPASL